ncbi:hypothetical protein STCU_07780, partial [Strigomonas culicis]
MSWPVELLNDTNKKLREVIERRTAELEEKRHLVAEHHEVVDYMRQSLTQATRQFSSLDKQIHTEAEAVEKLASEVRQLQHEVDGGRRTVRQQEELLQKLIKSRDHFNTLINEKGAALRERTRESVTLEEEAKAIIVAHIERRRVGEALEAELKNMSQTLWNKLERWHASVARYEDELRAAEAEHEAVLRELDHVRAQLLASLKDHHESVDQLAKVVHQSETLDTSVQQNADRMAELKAEYNRKLEQKEKLLEAREQLTRASRQMGKQRDNKRSLLDTKVNRLREYLQLARDDANEMDITGRYHRAERLRRRKLVEQYQNLHFLLEDRREALDQLKAQLGELRLAAVSIEKEVQSMNIIPPAILYRLRASLQKKLDSLENRFDRTSAKRAETVQHIMAEAARADDLCRQIGYQKKMGKQIEDEESKHKGSLEELLKIHKSIGQDIEARKVALADAHEEYNQLYRNRQEVLEVQVQDLRSQLVAHMEQHRQLLQGATTLRSALHRTSAQLLEQKGRRAQVAERQKLTQIEVANLVAEEGQLEERKRVEATKVESESVTLRTLMQAADGQLKERQDLAGLEELLRAQVQMEENHLQAAMQGTLVELHAEQNAVREQADALRRLTRQRDLIRMRYEEAMAALTKAVEAPLDELSAAGEDGLPRAPLMEAGAPPEALHAHLLLRRSILREQLMERGNYLDVRILSLERESENLRRMLEAIKAERHSMCAAVEQQKKTSGRSSKPFTDQNTNVHFNKNRSGASVAAQKDLQLLGEAKGYLQAGLQERTLLLQTEVKLQDEVIATVSDHRSKTREHLLALRATLKELQQAALQKRNKMQRLKDALHTGRMKQAT